MEAHGWKASLPNYCGMSAGSNGHRNCLTLVLVVPFRSTIWSIQSFATLWAVPPAQDPSPTCDRENAGINPLPLQFKPKHGSTPPTCSKHSEIQSICGPHGSHLRQPRQSACHSAQSQRHRPKEGCRSVRIVKASGPDVLCRGTWP